MQPLTVGIFGFQIKLNVLTCGISVFLLARALDFTTQVSRVHFDVYIKQVPIATYTHKKYEVPIYLPT